MSQGEANQGRFLGALLGMAIGDALGMPVAGLDRATIGDRFGTIETYHRREFEDGAEIKAGEFTDESEIALCIVESATANDGDIDPDLTGPRMLFLARGESKRWMHPDTLEALTAAESDHAFVRPLNEDGPVSPDIAARGIPVGLLHSVGALDPEALRADSERVVRITHGSPVAIDAATAVAYGVMLAARGAVDPTDWRRETAAFLGSGSIANALAASPEAGNASQESAGQVIAGAFAIAASATTFEAAVFDAVNLGGAADSRGAVAGALAGARFGVEGIPQRLIDGAEGRIYVSLAAPWFYRAAKRRAGALIDLQQERGAP